MRRSIDEASRRAAAEPGLEEIVAEIEAAPSAEARRDVILRGMARMGVPEGAREQVAREADRVATTFPSRPPLGCHKRVVLPEVATLAVDMACLVGAGAVAAHTAACLKTRSRTVRQTTTDIAIVNNGILAGGSLLWPLIFNTSVGYHRVAAEPRLLAGFLWPLVINAVDLAHVTEVPPLTPEESKTADRSLTMDAQAVISAAFAMGTLMSGLKTRTGTRIIMFALVLALGGVIPTPRISSRTVLRSAVQTSQRVMLSMSISFILTGIGADLIAGTDRDGDDPECDAPIPPKPAPAPSSAAARLVRDTGR